MSVKPRSRVVASKLEQLLRELIDEYLDQIDTDGIYNINIKSIENIGDKYNIDIVVYPTFYHKVTTLLSSDPLFANLLQRNLQFKRKIVERIREQIATQYNINLEGLHVKTDNNRITLTFGIHNTSTLDSLPEEILFSIIMDYTYDELIKLCKTSIKNNNKVCNNNKFWRLKFAHDTRDSDDINDNGYILPRSVDPKQAYRNYGKLLSFGANMSGQLGLEVDDEFVSVPTKLLLYPKGKNIICGIRHVFIVDENEDYWLCGTYGLLNRTTKPVSHHFYTKPAYLPITNIYDSNIYSIHNLESIDETGNTGDPTTLIINKEDIVLIQSSNILSHKLFSDDMIFNPNMLYEIKYKVKFQSIETGYAYVILKDFDNKLWGVGTNESGNLGLGTNSSTQELQRMQLDVEVESVRCGYLHTIIKDINGTIWATGDNTYGQLGTGNNNNENRPVSLSLPFEVNTYSCGRAHTVFLDTDGNLWSCGLNTKGSLGLDIPDEHINIITKIDTEVKFIHVICGHFHTLALSDDHDVYTWGDNQFGQLGLGDTEDRYIPTKVDLDYKINNIFTSNMSNFSYIEVLY